MKRTVDPTVSQPCLQSLTWPSLVEGWPRAEMEMEGLSGRILKGDTGWVIFMAADRDVVVPTHHHGAQWGVVLEGRMELTIGDRTCVYERGESHEIPAGVDHQAVLYAGWRGMYVFGRPTTTSSPGSSLASNTNSA